MGSRCDATPQTVKQFMALLKKKSSKSCPLSTLLDEAGRLCQTLQDCPARMEKLEKAMAQSRHWEDLLTSIHVVQACVRLYMGMSQYSTACELLKRCRATEREQLVELWNEIHYRKMMEEWHRPSLTAVQRFRCRKRNPPPASLCPEGVKSRLYPRAMRQKLQSFATEVTSNPSRKQRDDLAREFNLLPRHIYNWFANYRRRRKPGPSQPDEPVGRFGLEEESACRENPADKKTAGGLYEDAGVEQMEEPLGMCPPAQEQADGPRDCSSNRAFLVLQSSALQGERPEDFAVGVEFPSLARTADLTLLYLQTEPNSGASRTSDPVEPRREQADPTAILWVQSPLAGPCRGCPTWPAARRAPSAVDRAVQCSLGSLEASGAHLFPGVCVEARSQTVSEQADLEIERLVRRERQLGSVEPHSSAPSALGKPRCFPMLPVPSPEERPSSTREQVPPGDSVNDPLAVDTLWAAWLLCEFSTSSQM